MIVKTMATRSSIRLRVLAATAGLAVAGLGLAFTNLHNALVERQGAQSLAASSKVLATLSSATIDLSLERSASQLSLERPSVVDPALRALIDTQRSDADATFDRLLAETADLTATAKADVFRESIRDLRGQLTPLRADFDRILAMPLRERPVDIVYSLPRALKAVVVAFEAQRHLLRGPGLMLPTEISMLDSMRDQAWQIREFGGRERTYISIAAANREPILDTRLEEMAVLARRVTDAWLDIQKLAVHDGLPASVQHAIERVQETYFGRYEKLRQAMVAEARNSSPNYPEDLDGFFSQSADALEATVKLAATASAAIEEFWIAHAQLTLRTVLVDAVAAILLVLTSVGCAVVTVSTFRRLDLLRHRMQLLANGEAVSEVPYSASKDEVGAMARTVLVFRETAREREDSERDLRVQHVRFGAAINNMSEALCMFDADNRLVVGNQRLAGMLGLPTSAISCGMTIDDMIRALDPFSMLQDIERTFQSIQQLRSENKRAAHIQDLSDGRTLALNFAVVEDGGWLVTLENITAQRLVEARIAHMAHHDALTGLPNRSLFHERLGQAVALSRRSTASALLCLDLDGFKAINDTFGHPVGDALLCEVGRRLQRQVRDTDTVARLGGDEFAILQVSISVPEDSASLAQRLIEAISAPFELDGNKISVGTSIGIALIPDDSSDPGGLVLAADLALYWSKKYGRGGFCFFKPSMEAALQAQRVLEGDLRNALRQEQFHMVYQPLVNISSGQVCGFEALLRWKHPEKGLISPAEFIPFAEKLGLIIPLGKWILQRACADAATMPGSLKVAVNLSPVQLTSSTLVKDVAAALAATGLPASRLELEITETAMLEDTEAILATLHQLRDLGASIALDDFGTGYSSLSHLRLFPFDKVKIDRSFIAGLGKASDCDAIVGAVISLCQQLGMIVTSEGVETETQLRRLTDLRCTEVQGYLLGRPCPLEQLSAACKVLTKDSQAELGRASELHGVAA